MNKFIRTQEKIYKITNNKYDVFEENGVFKIHSENMGHHWDNELDVIKQAETIEELIMPGDMLVVGNKQNQMPIFVESLEYLKSWLYCHDIYKIEEFFIKKGNNWILTAKLNENGNLELFQ